MSIEIPDAAHPGDGGSDSKLSLRAVDMGDIVPEDQWVLTLG